MKSILLISLSILLLASCTKPENNDLGINGKYRISFWEHGSKNTGSDIVLNTWEEDIENFSNIKVTVSTEFDSLIVCYNKDYCKKFSLDTYTREDTTPHGYRATDSLSIISPTQFVRYTAIYQEHTVSVSSTYFIKQ